MRNGIYTTLLTIFIVLFSACGGENIQTVDKTPNEKSVTNSPSMTATVENNQIELSWMAHSDAVSYILEWGESADTLYDSEYFNINKTDFIHKDLDELQTYYYRLSIILKDEKVLYSNTVAVRTGNKEQITQSDSGF